MKRYLILLVLLLCSAVVLFGQEPEDDPNVMWTCKWNFSTYPAVHPNGNILIGHRTYGDVIEINGLTGELVRRIDVAVSDYDPDFIDISNDGTRMVIARKVVDYATGKVISELPGTSKIIKFLHPSNNILLIRLYSQQEYSFIKWNIDEGTSEGYKIAESVTAIEVSKDGKYFAVASKDMDEDIDYEYRHTHFYLYDAQTMKPIRQLEDVVSESRTIDAIQFSENSKYVGYGQPTGGVQKATFFTCEPPYRKWEIERENWLNGGAHGLGFIKDEFVYLSCIRGPLVQNSVIYDIQNDKIIYETEQYQSYYPLYNYKYNSIIIGGRVSLSFDKILQNVGVEEPPQPMKNLNIKYANGLLRIIDYETISPNITLSISDTLGNVLLNRTIVTTNSIIEIPLVLPAGTYILQIQDEPNYHSQKFIVVN